MKKANNGAILHNGATGKELANYLNNYFLKGSTEYAFQSAFFSFEGFLSYFDGIENAIDSGCKVRFLFWEYENDKTRNFIVQSKKEVIKRFSFSLLTSPQVEKLSRWIKDKKILFKMISMKNHALFHNKTGYVLRGSEGISWSGSANHSFKGFEGNSEDVTITSFTLQDREKFEKNWVVNNENMVSLPITEIIEDCLDFETKKRNNNFPKMIDVTNGLLVITSDEKMNMMDYPNVALETDGWGTVVSKNTEWNKYSVYEWTQNNDDFYVTENLEKILGGGINELRRKFADASFIKSEFEDLDDNFEYINYKNECSQNLVRKPYDVQVKQAFYATKLKKSLNFSVPGTGKTMVALTMLNYLKKDGVKSVVVLGPPSSRISWKDEFSETFGREPKMITLKDQLQPNEFASFFEEGGYKNFDIVFSSYQYFSGQANKIKNIEIKDAIFVLDEVHKIKNTKGRMAMAIKPIIKNSEYALLLTGTPTPNGTIDIQNIIEMAYGSAFTSLYAELNFTDQSSLIDALFIRVDYKMLGMKFKQIDHKEFYSVSAEVKEEISELLHLIKKGVYKMFGKQHQIKKMLSDSNGTKLTSLIDIIKTNNYSKVLVWANYHDTFKLINDNIIKNLPSYEVITYNSKTGTLDEKEKNIKIFKSTNKKIIMIANPASLAESVSLHHSTDAAIYYEFDYDLIKWLQSRNRTFRAGMIKDAIYHIMVSADFAFDNKVLESLIKKETNQTTFLSNDNDNDIENLLNLWIEAVKI